MSMTSAQQGPVRVGQGESPRHKNLKKKVYGLLGHVLASQNWWRDTECSYFGTLWEHDGWMSHSRAIRCVPDVIVTCGDGAKAAIEVQVSGQTASMTLQRTANRMAAGLPCLWLFGRLPPGLKPVRAQAFYELGQVVAHDVSAMSDPEIAAVLRQFLRTVGLLHETVLEQKRVVQKARWLFKRELARIDAAVRGQGGCLERLEDCGPIYHADPDLGSELHCAIVIATANGDFKARLCLLLCAGDVMSESAWFLEPYVPLVRRGPLPLTFPLADGIPAHAVQRLIESLLE